VPSVLTPSRECSPRTNRGESLPSGPWIGSVVTVYARGLTALHHVDAPIEGTKDDEGNSNP
jgi:hypothetical protein